MEIKKVGIVGLGVMGHAIARFCAEHGLDVVAGEIDDDCLERGMGSIRGVLEGQGEPRQNK